MASKKYQQFLASVDEPAIERGAVEPVNIWALKALNPKERLKAENLLIERLETSQDGRLADAVGLIDCQRAIPILQKRLQDATGFFRLSAVVALGTLDSSFDVGEAIATLLSQEPDHFARTSAVMALRTVPGGTADAALVNALSDEVQLVRGGASLALAEKYDLNDNAQYRGSPAAVAISLAASSLSRQRELGAERMQAIVQAVDGDRSKAGQFTAGEPSSAYENFFKDALLSPESDATTFDYEAFNKLVAFEKDWARSVVFELSAQGNQRALASLKHVAIDGDQAILAEICDRLSGPDKTVVESALASLV